MYQFAHRATPFSSKKLKEKVVQCTECFQNSIGKRCDNGTPCWPCKHRGVSCERIKCEYFAAGTWSKVNCRLVHSDDGYSEDSLVEKRRLGQVNGAGTVILRRPED
jgi:hypothetical protein